MKKFMMLAIAGLFFSTAKAQVGATLVVNNYTNCQVHFMVVAKQASNCTGSEYVTTIYSVGPNSMAVPFTANNAFCSACTPQTLSPGDDIVGAYIYDGDPNICGSAAMVTYIGDASCSSAVTTTSSGFTPLDIIAPCSALSCNGVVATWGTNGSDPMLDFN